MTLSTGVLTITFSEAIDVTPAANVVPTKIHVRESGTYTGGITLTAGELGTAADASTISFTLNMSRLATVKGLAAPELTIDPGAVRDTSGNLIVGTFDVSTATFADVTFSVFDKDTVPTGMAFSNDGDKMFVVGSFGDDIHEYTLTTPFDITTAAHARSFNVTEQDILPTGVAFSNDGAKMFVVGNDGNDINEYTLTTPFNVSTAAFAHLFSVSDQDMTPEGMAFSNDGAKMFVVGRAGDAVNEYALTTPFNVSTAAFAHLFNVTAQNEAPRGMAFSNDGAKLFVIGTAGMDINEYTLTTPFDVSTARFADVTFDVLNQKPSPHRHGVFKRRRQDVRGRCYGKYHIRVRAKLRLSHQGD